MARQINADRHDLHVRTCELDRCRLSCYAAACRTLTDYQRVALTVLPAQLSAAAAEDGVAMLTTALRRVMTETGFRERVTKLSRRLRAHKQTPVEQVCMRTCRHVKVFESKGSLSWPPWCPARDLFGN